MQKQYFKLLRSRIADGFNCGEIAIAGVDWEHKPIEHFIDHFIDQYRLFDRYTKNELLE